MKILHIIAGAPQGGAETFCFDAIKSLHEQGVEQHVICRPHDNFVNILNDKNIPRTHIGFNRFTKPFEQQTIQKTLNAFNPDLIHCWMSRASSYAPRKTDKPVLGWFGGYYDLKNYKNCDFYMGVTRDIVTHIGKETGTPDKAYLVHTFGTLDEDTPVKRADFNIPEDAKLVLLLSRMHWKKGIDTLLSAAQTLKDTHFLLAGDGPDLQKFKDMAKDMGVSDRAHFPGWRNDRAALLAISDVCVLPSRYEPFGTVIAEAWYGQTPLVATKAAGAKQYVTHDKDGLLCEIDDIDGLTTQLDRALNDKKLRKTLVNGGTKTYNALFSKDVVTKALLDAYNDITEKHNHAKAA